MKVIKEFYCTQENKRYLVGSTYTGERKDLSEYLKATEKKEIKPRKKKAEKK